MKEKCLNHPNKNSHSLCHSCGKYLCEDCLDVGEEYYYCKEEKCQLLLKEEKSRLQIIKIKKDSPEATGEAKNQGLYDLKAVKPEDLTSPKRIIVKTILALKEAYRAGNKEGAAQEKEKLIRIVSRGQKLKAIGDALGLTDTDMEKISHKNPLLMSQSEFNLYLDDLKQRAFKLADNKFEKARIDLDKKSKERLKATIKQKDEETSGDIKEKRAAMKTIKELNKALNEKQWYRFLKVLWLIFYLIFLLVVMKRITIISFNSFMGATIVFSIFTLSFLGATAVLKRVAIYTFDYISNGKILLKEKRHSLLLIVLWGILSIVILFVIDDFNKVIALNLNYARDYTDRGFTYYLKRQNDKAIEDYNKAIAIDPNYAQAYSNRGYAYADKKQYDRAIEDYTKAIALKPNYAWLYYNRGDAYADKKQYDRAIEDYTEAIALKPNDADAYSHRGFAYNKKGQYDRAIEDYTKAIALEKFDYFRSAYYSDRGFIYYLKKQYDRAIEDYSEAIALNPNDAWLYYNRGDAYADKKQYDRAIEDYTEAIALKPNDAQAYIISRGFAYADKKQYDRAIEDFDKACAMGDELGCMALKKALKDR
ncbi:MAG: tetratricopeptide repeat protein [Nitrospirota bacterium]